MATRFNYNNRFPAELARDAAFRRFLKDTADAGARAAQQVAPVASGDYRNSIHGEIVDGPDGPVGRIVADDWKASIIELHGVNDGRGPLAPLRKGAESLNLRVEGRR